MSDDMSEFFRNSPGFQNMARQQGYFAEQDRQRQRMMQEAEEIGEELAQQRDEERRRNQEHLEASQATAARLEDVNQGLIYVSDALQGVNRRLDQQAEDTERDNKRQLILGWVSAVAATLAVAAPFIVLWLQSGG